MAETVVASSVIKQRAAKVRCVELTIIDRMARMTVAQARELARKLSSATEEAFRNPSGTAALSFNPKEWTPNKNQEGGQHGDQEPRSN